MGEQGTLGYCRLLCPYVPMGDPEAHAMPRDELWRDLPGQQGAEDLLVISQIHHPISYSCKAEGCSLPCVEDRLCVVKHCPDSAAGTCDTSQILTLYSAEMIEPVVECSPSPKLCSCVLCCMPGGSGLHLCPGN